MAPATLKAVSANNRGGTMRVWPAANKAAWADAEKALAAAKAYAATQSSAAAAPVLRLLSAEITIR